MFSTVVAFIVVALIVYVMFFSGPGFTGYTPDQIAMQSFDPAGFKWFGRVDDKWGMSPKDYFLENQTLSSSHLIPMLKDDRQFHSSLNMENMRMYYPSSVLSIKKINSVETPQYHYFTIDESPALHAERQLLKKAGEQYVNFDNSASFKNPLEHEYNMEFKNPLIN